MTKQHHVVYVAFLAEVSPCGGCTKTQYVFQGPSTNHIDLYRVQSTQPIAGTTKLQKQRNVSKNTNKTICSFPCAT